MPLCQDGVGRQEEIIVTLPPVKSVLLILSLFFSLLSGSGEGSVAISSEAEGLYCLSDTSSEKPSTDYARERECCITAVQGYNFSSNESSHSVSLRSFQSSRRSSPQAKSSFRFMKSGKVIDNKSLHPCLILSYQLMAGLVFSHRYLHIICKLRI